jgi:hypothetical protein
MERKRLVKCGTPGSAEHGVIGGSEMLLLCKSTLLTEYTVAKKIDLQAIVSARCAPLMQD